MDEVLEFLKKCGTYYIATVDGDAPEVRPFGTIHKYEDKLYFQTGKVKPVSQQIAANPKVAICAFDPETGKWLRVSATAVDDPRIEAQESMLEAYPDLGAIYKAGDGNTQVLYLKDAVATFSSFTAEPYTIEF